MKRTIKLRESELNTLISVSIKNVLNEGQSDGNPIEKWNYWCANFYYDFIEQAWADDPLMAKHLRNKFDTYYDQVGSYGAMTKFYLNLDSTNREILEKFVMNKY